MDLLEEKSVSQLALANSYKYFIQETTMSFTKQLFEMTSMALPEVTARKFSRYLGKSEGYYGSVSSQNLDISTNSLLFLSEILEHKNSASPNKKITEIQSMIALEIANRVQRIDSQNEAVRKLVIRSIAKVYMESDNNYTAPPIVIC